MLIFYFIWKPSKKVACSINRASYNSSAFYMITDIWLSSIIASRYKDVNKSYARVKTHNMFSCNTGTYHTGKQYKSEILNISPIVLVFIPNKMKYKKLKHNSHKKYISNFQKPVLHKNWACKINKNYKRSEDHFQKMN